MKYKEFVKWCNERAFDGCWGMNEAIICIGAMQDIKRTPFGKEKRNGKK